MVYNSKTVYYDKFHNKKNIGNYSKGSKYKIELISLESGYINSNHVNKIYEIIKFYKINLTKISLFICLNSYITNRVIGSRMGINKRFFRIWLQYIQPKCILIGSNIIQTSLLYKTYRTISYNLPMKNRIINNIINNYDL